ncbi:MAG TPA: hypothetical protein VNN10_12805 [Dehalococcoidia bacterium]|nr:hypothetical protein [Dehalococcoidia bacterium]
MKTGIVRGLAVLLAGAALGWLGTALIDGSTASADHPWGNYHWARTSNPFTLKVGDNVSSKWDAYLDEAVADWSLSSVLDLAKVAGATNPKNCRPTAGRIEVCNSRYGNNAWLGLAQIWVNGDHIIQAVAKMNDTYFDTATYNTPAWRRLVMCQEIAHGFGLGHTDENFNNPNEGSCMDYTNDPDGGPGGASETDPSNEHPNAHDFEQLELIYAHLDSTTTISQGEGSGPGNGRNSGPFDDPSEWGRLVSSSADGRVQVYERDLGGGIRIITHVTWAEPRPGRR